MNSENQEEGAKVEGSQSFSKVSNRKAIAAVADLARELGTPIAIVICADGVKVRTISWGETFKLCAFAKEMGDMVHAAVMQWDGSPKAGATPS